MSEPYRRPYLDACPLVDFIMGTAGRVDAVRDVLSRARRGEFQLHCSTLTIAEVHRHRHSPRLPPKERKAIVELFEAEMFVFTDLTRFIAEKAHDLTGVYTALKPNDSIHLATALFAKCDVLLTYDTGLLGCGHPNIRIEEPSAVSLGGLFDEVSGGDDSSLD